MNESILYLLYQQKTRKSVEQIKAASWNHGSADFKKKLAGSRSISLAAFLISAAVPGKAAVMLKLRVLKERMEIPKKGAKIPTAKALRESGIPVLVQKTVGISESATQIIAYQNGYIVYQVGKRTTVFPVNLEEGYLYSSVMEEHKSMKTISALGSSDSDMLVPELLQMDIAESYFDENEWFLHFMLIGEDRLAHNLSSRDRGRCISYSGISEECDFMDDKSEAFLDELLNQELMEELLSVLNERQRRVVELYFEGQYTQEQIAKMMGMKGRTSVTNMLSRALKKMEQSFDPKEFKIK